MSEQLQMVEAWMICVMAGATLSTAFAAHRIAAAVSLIAERLKQ